MTDNTPDDVSQHYAQRHAEETQRHQAAVAAIIEDEQFARFLTKGWMTVPEAAAWLSISVRSVSNHASASESPSSCR